MLLLAIDQLPKIPNFFNELFDSKSDLFAYFVLLLLVQTPTLLSKLNRKMFKVLLEQVSLHQILQAVAVPIEFKQIKHCCQRQVGNHKLTFRVHSVDEVLVEGTYLF